MRRKTTPTDKNEAKKIKEKEIEAYLKKQLTEVGGLCMKWTGGNGVPDRICFLNGNIVFVELKRPFGKPRPDQLECHRKLLKRGCCVMVIDRFEQCDELVDLMIDNRGWGGW